MNDNFPKYCIIHLKNVIFLKLVIYSILIISLLWLIQVFNDSLVKSLDINNQAQDSIDRANIKLNSIINSDKEILGSLDKYKTMLADITHQNCYDGVKLEENFNNIANKYKLIGPIDTIITRSFLKNKVKRTHGDNIYIKNYDVKLHFAASNFTTLLAIIKEAYYSMPKNTVITSLLIENEAVLYPNIVDSLSVTRVPSMMNADFIMRSREIRFGEQ